MIKIITDVVYANGGFVRLTSLVIVAKLRNVLTVKKYII